MSTINNLFATLKLQRSGHTEILINSFQQRMLTLFQNKIIETYYSKHSNAKHRNNKYPHIHIYCAYVKF